MGAESGKFQNVWSGISEKNSTFVLTHHISISYNTAHVIISCNHRILPTCTIRMFNKECILCRVTVQKVFLRKKADKYRELFWAGCWKDMWLWRTLSDGEVHNPQPVHNILGRIIIEGCDGQEDKNKEMESLKVTTMFKLLYGYEFWTGVVEHMYKY